MDNLIDLKWSKLLSRVWLFDFVPFADFVLVAGSMAMGNVSEDSDFDVIVGVKSSRIFTVRMFCYVLFGLLGWRRKKGVASVSSKDKFCFSHFVTPEAYRLSKSHNEYWKKLYQSLVPVYGSLELIQKFFDANAGWLGERRMYKSDTRHVAGKQKLIKIFFDKLLSGKVGDYAEDYLKQIQVARIEKSLKIEKQYKPRIIFNDKELEFHPETKRIEEYCEK